MKIGHADVRQKWDWCTAQQQPEATLRVRAYCVEAILELLADLLLDLWFSFG